VKLFCEAILICVDKIIERRIEFRRSYGCIFCDLGTELAEQPHIIKGDVHRCLLAPAQGLDRLHVGHIPAKPVEPGLHCSVVVHEPCQEAERNHVIHDPIITQTKLHRPERGTLLDQEILVVLIDKDVGCI
jgi:hypothetical protein